MLYLPGNDVYNALREGRQESVRTDQEKAMCYVWGREDAGDVAGRDMVGDQSVAFQVFADLYAAHSLAYAADLIHFKHNIKAAYDMWLAGETIEGTDKV